MVLRTIRNSNILCFFYACRQHQLYHRARNERELGRRPAPWPALTQYSLVSARAGGRGFFQGSTSISLREWRCDLGRGVCKKKRTDMCGGFQGARTISLRERDEETLEGEGGVGGGGRSAFFVPHRAQSVQSGSRAVPRGRDKGCPACPQQSSPRPRHHRPSRAHRCPQPPASVAEPTAALVLASTAIAEPTAAAADALAASASSLAAAALALAAASGAEPALAPRPHRRAPSLPPPCPSPPLPAPVLAVAAFSLSAATLALAALALAEARYRAPAWRVAFRAARAWTRPMGTPP